MNLSILADLLVAALLAATSGYCVVLNRRLGALRGAQGELKTMIAEFDRAIGSANASIANLRQAGEAAGKDLEERVASARTLVDELNFLTDSGNKLADRLVAERPVQKPRLVEVPVDVEVGAPAIAAPRSEAERELLQALRRARG